MRERAHHPLLLFFFWFFLFAAPVRFSHQRALPKDELSISFPLTPVSHPRRIRIRIRTPTTNSDSLLLSSPASSSSTYKSSFTYSRVLVISLPVGTPPQSQPIILDTGSQLSWIRCNNNNSSLFPKVHLSPPPPTTTFDPSLSSSFSALPCDNSLCTPSVPDYSLPTSCDQHRLCHYSYFYADGTLAEGNLVREQIPLAGTPPLVLGCASGGTDGNGTLGMNLGRLSFASQSKVTKFSYCVPGRTQSGPAPTGSFYLGNNPSSGTFRYIGLMSFPQSQRMPNLDPLAYTVVMQGIRIGTQKLNIPPSVFVPDAGGSGQTMIDSGTEFSYFVDEAYDKVKEEVARVAGRKLKQGFSYGGGLMDICFDGDPKATGESIGDMAFLFEKGVEVSIPKGRTLVDVGDGVQCLAIGRSSMLGAAGNIIGNFHQQNLWVEFDLANRRVGFGKADCGWPQS
ncbi:hypothetical protein MLD38_022862 [Melastoma candidum]|uniref:Uncharacterized protein n=1 Tax=Melastoma candidum TaxID=119954 RepID=A0ACB9QPM9_9MYRT|nr:hypothetical protein MLD38_022862 [Melastoma candidum]